MKKRVGIFVDVQNIYYTCRQAYQRQFNYRALMQQLEGDQDIEISVAFAYAIASQDNGQRKFQDALRHLGFQVKLKPYITRSDGSAKGDWDVGITIDIMEYSHDLDDIYLLSGDGDFTLLLGHIKHKHNIKTHVVSVPSLTAKSLLDIVDTHLPITLESTLLN